MKLIHREKPSILRKAIKKIHSHLECVVEHPCGRREYMSFPNYKLLTKNKSNGVTEEN